MSVISRLRSGLISLLVSEKALDTSRSFAEKRRRLLGKPHSVSVFLELDDPYSYLLAHCLPILTESYDIEMCCYLTTACAGEEFRPHPDMLAAYAEEDCVRLAAELGVPFLDKGRAPPVEHRRALIDALAASSDSASFDDDLLAAISMYWRGDAEGVAKRIGGAVLAGEGERLIADNQRKLIDLGHYNCATVHYAGEWYWGIDRLHYLTDRLDQLGARREDATPSRLAAIRQAMQVSLPITPPSAARELPPLEFFYSFRSPYSFLSVQRVFDIADAFGLDLRIRPVLPMLMRGLKVPKPKLEYIVKDTSREARRLGIPYGKFADPLGNGVERCMAVFEYAHSQKRERDFLLNAGEAIWARGVDVATDRGMRTVTGRTGLFWPDVLAAMQSNSWCATAEDNCESMMASGCWGVPALRLGNFMVWGQDRDWILVRHIEELCDTGDGILV